MKNVYLSVCFLVLMSLSVGCQTLKEITNLRNVQFNLGQLTQINLAGVELDNINSYGDIRPTDVIRLTAAFARGELPLSFQLNVEAQNPSDNQVAARLTRMDWTLFLEERETISGVIDQEHVLNPGDPVTIPVTIELEVLEFFDRNARDIIDLALALSGEGGASKNIKLVARPVVDTILGPLRYPEPITVVNTKVG